jgi:hypothetical protein
MPQPQPHPHPPPSGMYVQKALQPVFGRVSAHNAYLSSRSLLRRSFLDNTSHRFASHAPGTSEWIIPGNEISEFRSRRWPAGAPKPSANLSSTLHVQCQLMLQHQWRPNGKLATFAELPTIGQQSLPAAERLAKLQGLWLSTDLWLSRDARFSWTPQAASRPLSSADRMDAILKLASLIHCQAMSVARVLLALPGITVRLLLAAPTPTGHPGCTFYEGTTTHVRRRPVENKFT